MGQCVLHQFPSAMVEYEFKCRTPGIDLTPYIDEIKDEVIHWCNLRFTNDELNYLSSIRFFKPDYIEYLRNFQPNYKHIYIRDDVNQDSGIFKNEFTIKVIGPWVSTIYAEVPLLSIVSEVYMRNKYPEIYKSPGKDLNLVHMKEEIWDMQLHNMEQFKFADFGTRRRFSFDWQKRVIEMLKGKMPGNFTGTSNVLFAKEFGITAVGTMAHEFLMATQSMVRISESQKYAFQKWADEYRGDLGIVLSDVVGMDAFLRDFDLYFSKLFDGARHDSGNPTEWCEKLIKHYQDMKIDPRTKRAVFSDGLNFNTCKELCVKFGGRIQLFFGIGTYLTNHIDSVEPIQIVIKMTKCNGHDVAKISDSQGKQMCKNDEYLEYLKGVFNIHGI